MTRVVRTRDGMLDIGGKPVPLVAGEVQFWRLNPDDWNPVLDTVVAAGVPIVSTYLSWRRHEPEPGRFGWGAASPSLGAARFVRACGERGLFVLLKPGPWICAEEPGGGYPDWLLARADDLALDAADRPVRGYNPPFVHPVPSVHAPGYFAAARAWLTAVWAELGSLVYPDGPIVAVQLDNEPGYAFQDALYAADYHPAAIAAFRAWLAARYPDAAAWRGAWGAAAAGDVAHAQPPRPAGAQRNDHAIRDWVAFTQESIVGHLARLWRVHEELGFGHLLPTVNLINHPVHDVPVPHVEMRRALPGAAVGGDQYYEPPISWADVHRLALTAATARAAGEPAVWAPELMSGIWRSPGEVASWPDPTLEEQAAWWGAALALGYQGFDLYMLADRENWALAPMGPQGTATSLLAQVRDLTSALSAEPDLVRSRLRTGVALLWDDEDAFAAYTVTGPARQPDVPWCSPRTALAYRETVRIATELISQGFTYDLWCPRRQAAPPNGLPVVASATSRWFDDHAPRGIVLVAPDVPVTPSLVGRRPPALVVPGTAGAGIATAGADAGGIATIHDGRRSLWLHVARWSSGPADLVFADSWPAGDWLPWLGSGEPLRRLACDRWRLPAKSPHLVFRWTPRITNNPADGEGL
ncbi:MAG: beta-galactosidase [Micrococcales bacterium]|nr:beta-galactosidase [Micrococcales bacterium]